MRDENLAFAVECVGKVFLKGHVEGMACSEERGVEEDLVGCAETEGELVCAYCFAVALGAFGAHDGGGVEEMKRRERLGVQCEERSGGSRS